MAAGDKGYIKLHRELQDNPLWKSEPFSKGQAWVDLLLRANHQYNEFLIGNELIVIEQGQFFTSELKLAEKWKWSRKKVRAYLRLLETLKMATTVGTSKGTTVTIENYRFYQGNGTTKGTTKGTSKGLRRDNAGYTNKNDKECLKNDKEYIGTKNQIPPTKEMVREYCTERKNSVDAARFMDHYTTNGWKVGKSKMVDWQSAVRTWERNNTESKPKEDYSF